MAPFATEDNSSQRKDLGPTLDVYDEAELKSKANKHLLYNGSAPHPDVITACEGLYLYTASGRKILDWTSGQMSCLLGHGHPEIVQVILKHAMHLDHLFSGMLSPPVISLGERLCSNLPDGLDKAFFLSTGGESNEAAIKLAKSYTGKFEIVGLGASWHGMTGQAVGAQYHFGRKGHGPMMPGMHMLPSPNAYRSVFRKPDGSYDWEAELEYGWSMVDMASCGSLAACIVECVQSSGGMHVLPPGYLKAMKRHCEARGMLLIVDEAQTGIGRCGDFVAVNHDGVVPDILTLSKTLGNGLPLSAVVTSERIERVCKERDFFFYTTHLNDPLPAAVGDKVLEILLRDNLVEHARRLGQVLQDGLRTLMSRYGCIGDVRGRGLLAGVEIVADRETKARAPELAKRIGDRIYELGVWANLSTHESFGGVFRIAPPITVTEKQLGEGLGMFEEALRETEGTMPLY
ncbi:2,2-dialkylglycine decarboxylase-like protein [Hapsidospora chrysogenum ATCC 11550]|uniref:2,2-dialkylglycine decarboxylase-like protein n=1 Tax=Hapsidospora chrysogenum (strain ATCC 11550 / CBS 779.69 / DSM 880 / IAM 14645 / JCM 23072 / IMI 49137) TaxID=857340 RepID=A0A086T7V9_HAPC1|nr:2,2-dialkylglycine decarboxylase-like protein [Hapsidospora chrysogenum ATCC 11550]